MECREGDRVPFRHGVRRLIFDDGEDVGVDLENGTVVLLIFPLMMYNGRDLFDVVIGLVLPLQIANNQLLTR